MALIGKIRENTTLLLILIGLGTIGFIVTLSPSAGTGAGLFNDPTMLADINGRKVTIQEFTNVERLLYGGGSSQTSVYNQRDFLWNYFQDEALVMQEAEKIGLGVGEDELEELQFGQNLSPIIEQRFRNPQTFQVDRESLEQFRLQLENGTITPERRAYWNHQQKEIIVDRLKTKLGTIASKAVYAPAWMVETTNKERGIKVDFEYVQVPFAEVDNSEVSVTDSEINNYLRENAARYESAEEQRTIDYVVFNVEPTKSDINELYNEMLKRKEEFETTDNDTTFLEYNNSQFIKAYAKKADLDPAISDTLFNLPVGTVYGPYELNDAYNLVKILDKKVIPDSVRSRHILIKAEAQTQQSYFNAKKTADSLKNLIVTGVEQFDSLAARFGTDGTRTKGGDLGFAAPGQMVQQFNDLIFYDAEYDSTYVIATQFGVHVVEVLERKYETGEEGVRVGYLSEAIVPSETTQDSIYTKALEFAAANRTTEQLRTAAAEAGLTVQTSTKKKANDFAIDAQNLPAGETSRDIIRWAFDSDIAVGDVASNAYTYNNDQNFYNEKYVVIGLNAIQSAGLPTAESMRAEVEQTVINQKKAKIIMDNIQNKALSEVATQYSTSADTASQVTFNSNFIPGLGSEPVVIAKALGLEEGATSAPIEGTNGVFVVKVLSRTEDISPADPNLRRTIAGAVRTAARGQIATELRDNAKIKDRRSKFY